MGAFMEILMGFLGTLCNKGRWCDWQCLRFLTELRSKLIRVIKKYNKQLMWNQQKQCKKDEALGVSRRVLSPLVFFLNLLRSTFGLLYLCRTSLVFPLWFCVVRGFFLTHSSLPNNLRRFGGVGGVVLAWGIENHSTHGYQTPCIMK